MTRLIALIVTYSLQPTVLKHGKKQFIT